MHSPTPTVVIVGGGFAGVYAARHLRARLPREWQVVLFGEENHLVFTPLLGNVVGSSINPMHVVWPVRQMAGGVLCRTAAVTGVDLENREVVYKASAGESGRQRYDHLVLACGSRVNLDIIPGMAAHAWPVKTMGDALVLRNHLIGLLERAQVESDPDVRRRLLSVVVVGGGFSGIEVAGEVADLMTASCRFYDGLERSLVKVTVLQRGDRILPELPEKLSEFAAEKMRRRGIEVRLRSAARAVTAQGVQLQGGGSIDAETVVCTIGTMVNPLLTSLSLPMEKGRVKTAPDMRVEGRSEVWALGDCAAVPNAYDGQPSPPTAQFAVRQAKAVAENLARAAAGRPTKPFSFKPLGAFASIGSHNAVGLLLGMRCSGLPAWFMWRGIYLGKMPTLARKVQIAFDWLWQMFFPRDIVQLTTFQTERLSRAHFEAGQYVFHKGESGDRFYVIERGTAGIYLEESGPPVRTLGRGEYFGEAALLSAAPRSASVKAEEPLDLLVMGQNSFAQLTRHLQVLRTTLERSAQRARASDELRKAVESPRLAAVTVGEVMSRVMATLPADLTLGEALRRGRETGHHAFAVVDGVGQLAGVCTRTDFLQALVASRPHDAPVSELMRKPVLTVSEAEPLRAALVTLTREPVKRLVVVSGDDPGRPVGWVTLFDVLQSLGEGGS